METKNHTQNPHELNDLSSKTPNITEEWEVRTANIRLI